MSPTFRALGTPGFRLFWTGLTVANFVTWMQRVAQTWLVLELTGGNAAALGFAVGLQFLPFLLVTPWGGVLADRMSKRKLLIGTQSWTILVTGLTAALILTDVVALWHVYVLSFLFGVGVAVDQPTRQAFVSELVPREDITSAVGLSSVALHGSRLVGPAAAGVLIGVVGTGWVMALNTVLYLVPVLVLHVLRARAYAPPAKPPKPPGSRGSLREGVGYVRRRPDLVAVLVLVFFIGTFGFNFQLTLPLMATEVFDKGAAGFGALTTSMAVGSIAAALLIGRLTTVSKRLVVLCAMTFAVFEMAISVLPTYGTFLLALLPVGLASLATMTAANAYVQMSVPGHIRGRVMALYTVVMMGGTPLGAPLVGWIGQVLGPRWTLLGGGIGSLTGALLAAALLARARAGRRGPAAFRGSDEADRSGTGVVAVAGLQSPR